MLLLLGEFRYCDRLTVNRKFGLLVLYLFYYFEEVAAAKPRSVVMTEAKLQAIEHKLGSLIEKFKKLEPFVAAVAGLEKSLSHFNKDFEDFRTSQAQMKGDLKEIKKTLAACKQENVDLRGEVNVLRMELVRKEVKEKQLFLEVAGIPPTNGENLLEYVNKIAAKSSVVISTGDIVKVGRYGNRDGRAGYVLIEFAELEKRNNFLLLCKKTRMMASALGITGAHQPIYINEHLPAFLKKLLYEVRVFKREKGFQFAWVKNGQIFLKKAEKDNPIRINSLDDLRVLRSA